MNVFRRVVLPFVLVAAWSVPSRAQSASHATSSTPAAVQPSVPSDPLGRENPRGCIIGFIKAAQEERYRVAVQYFQPITGCPRLPADEEEKLASQLLTILSQKFASL